MNWMPQSPFQVISGIQMRCLSQECSCHGLSLQEPLRPSTASEGGRNHPAEVPISLSCLHMVPNESRPLISTRKVRQRNSRPKQSVTHTENENILSLGDGSVFCTILHYSEYDKGQCEYHHTKLLHLKVSAQSEDVPGTHWGSNCLVGVVAHLFLLQDTA